MPLTIYFDTRQLRRFLGAAEKRWPDAAGKALEKVGRLIFETSQAEVPKGETGVLSRDAMIAVHPRTVRITYFAAYARIVHFRKARHPEGKRKFLSGPLGRGKRILGAEIANAVQEAMDTTPK